MLKVEVDRRTWLRGDRDKAGLHVTPSGQQCCIGFACRAAGLTVEDIRGRAGVASLDNYPRARLFEQFPRWYQTGRTMLISSDAMTKLYRINDDSEINDKERERKLTQHGHAVGIAFSFVN